MSDLRELWDIGEESFRLLLETHLGRRYAALPGDQVTPEEIAMPMPGDGLIPVPDRVLMRAINIDAPAERVWPWLAQMMRGAGIYGWPRLESGDCASAARVLDGLPPPRIGDRVGELFELAYVDPPREILWQNCGPITVLGLTVRAVTLNYRIVTSDHNRSRLLTRQRCVLNQRGNRLTRQFSNLIHFLLPCWQLRSIKYHVEAFEAFGEADQARLNGSRHQAAPLIPAKSRPDR